MKAWEEKKKDWEEKRTREEGKHGEDKRSLEMGRGMERESRAGEVERLEREKREEKERMDARIKKILGERELERKRWDREKEEWEKEKEKEEWEKEKVEGVREDEKLEAERVLGGGEQSRARAHCKPGSQIRHPPPINSSPRASKPSGLPVRVAPPQNAPGRPEGWEPDSAWHARPVMETLRCERGRKGWNRQERAAWGVNFLQFLRWNFTILRSDFEEEEKGGWEGGKKQRCRRSRKKDVRLDKRYYIT